MKLISNQINPHFTLLDSLHAVASLLVGSGHKPLNTQLKTTLQSENVLFTNTARSALGLLCDTVKPDPRKKIALPAFICAVVATPFLSRGYQIEWIDTDDNGLIDPEDFAAKAENVSLVVVPHVFGMLAPLKEIKAIAELHDIVVVEDGAHAIRQLLPHFKPVADAQILSFGREKVVSCVSGGALIWPDNSPFHKALTDAKAKLKRPGLAWTIRHAVQPLIFALSLPWWQKGGKIIPWLAQKLRLLPLAVTPAEKKGNEDVPLRALALPQKRILLRGFRQYENRFIHAQAMALAWQEALEELMPQARFIMSRHAFRGVLMTGAPHYKEDWLFQLQQSQAPYHLHDWDGIPISPPGLKLSAFGYRPGQCKNAEYFACTYLTFPTNIRTKKADIKAFAKYVSAP